MDKVNLKKQFALISEYWSPQVVGEFNDCQVRLAKFKGKYRWHKHDYEDELFLVFKGKLLIKLRDQEIPLKEGEFLIVPKGVEHCPIAEEEAEIILIEPKTTLAMGNS